MSSVESFKRLNSFVTASCLVFKSSFLKNKQTNISSRTCKNKTSQHTSGHFVENDIISVSWGTKSGALHKAVDGLSSLLVFSLAPRSFLQVRRFSPLLKNQHFSYTKRVLKGAVSQFILFIMPVDTSYGSLFATKLEKITCE